MTTNESKDPDCCPPFDPAPWDGKTFQWDQKMFIRDHVCTIFFMPLNFGSVMKRLNRKVESAGASMPDWLCLSDHTSKWNMDVYLAVDREVPGAENTTLSGKFFTKVYEGSFNETGKWCKDFEGLVTSQNMKMNKMYMWYTTCPKCARKYGKNYVVIVGEIA